MKKKLLTTLLASMTLMSLAACSSKSPSATSKSSSSESSQQASSSEVPESTKESSSSKTSDSKNFSLMIEAAQSQVPSLKEQNAAMYSDIAITEGEDSTVIYTYTFAQASEVVPDVEALKPTMVKAMKPVIDGMKGLFPDVKIQVTYLNPDKSELMDFIITQEDTDKIEADTQ